MRFCVIGQVAQEKGKESRRARIRSSVKVERAEGDEQGWPALGHEEDARLIRTGFSGTGAVERNWSLLLNLPAHGAGGPRRLLGLGERPACPRALAMQTWDVWQTLSARYPPARTMSQIADCYRVLPDRGYDFEAAEAEYESQRLVQAFKQAHPVGGATGSHIPTSSSFIRIT